jgi:hypothetical protein
MSSVDLSDVLHVLAHELRTPVGVAHGYVRLLLDDRLPHESDRRRALEQMQKALGRISALTHETTALATWCDQGRQDTERVGARDILDRVAAAAYASPVTIQTDTVNEGATLCTLDPSALSGAIIDVIRATARELRGQPCTVAARTCDGRLELLAGSPDHLGTLSGGPGAPNAGPLALERGGLGLALVHAAIVLDAHGAERWTMNESRQIAGIRLPLEERPQP